MIPVENEMLTLKCLKKFKPNTPSMVDSAVTRLCDGTQGFILIRHLWLILQAGHDIRHQCFRQLPQ